MKLRFLLSFIFFSTLSISSFGQIGKPFIHNYSSKEYKAHVQNWAIIQDDRGLIYTGNGDGILEYDGENWRVIPLDNRTAPFGMKKMSDGRMFIGGSDTFGYLEADEEGKMTYVSLRHLMDSTLNVNRIMNVYEHKNTIIFQANTIRKLLIYDGTKIDTLGVKRTQWAFTIDKNTYFWDAREGMRSVENNAFVPVSNNDFFKTFIPEFIIPDQKNGLILYGRNVQLDAEGRYITVKTSVYALKNRDITQLEDVSDQYTKLISFLRSINYSGGYYARVERLPNQDISVLSRTQGLFVLDQEGNFKQQISKEDGLQSDAIYDYVITDKGNAFIAMNKGLAHVEIASPLSLWDEQAGLTGVVESIITFNGITYVATHQNVFYLEGDKAKPIKPDVSVENNQNWTFLNYIPKDTSQKPQLLLSSNRGVFRVQDSTATQVIGRNLAGTIYEFYQSKVNPDIVFCTYGDGIGIIRYQNNEWINLGVSKAFADDVRMMAQDKKGNLWLGTFRNGAIKIPYFENPDSLKAEDVKYYNLESGFPSLKNVLVYPFDGDVIFATEMGLYKYDETTDRMIPEPKLKGSGLTERDVFSFVQDPQGNVWVAGLQTTTGEIGVAKKTSDGYKFYNTPFKKIPEMMVLAHYLSDDGVMWFGGSEGVFRYDTKLDRDYYAPKQILIRQVRVGQDSTLFWGTTDQNTIAIAKIPYAWNSIRFDFALPEFGEGKTQYRYRLIGYQEEWTEWTTDTKAVYTNLFEGDYTFEVEAKNKYGIVTTNIASVTTTIKPPYHRTWWAYIIYGLALVGLMWAGIWLNTRRLEKDKQKLESIVQQRTAEIQQQKEEIEQQANNLMLANAEINQQKEEIEAQAESLRDANLSITSQNQAITVQKQEIEKSYQNIQTLSEIGQKITQILNQKDLVHTVYDNVNSLMPAEFFGIGLYNPKLERLEFEGFMEFGEELPFHYDKLEDKDKLSVRCFLSEQDIIENNYVSYLKSLDKEVVAEVGELPESIIYLPLKVEDKIVGVITVQSTKENAYDEQKLTILKTLTAYTSIALDNVSAYQTIESKNRNITDSIRYAQTIQGAILPHVYELEKNFAQHFVLFRPKDIVSGDFYWFACRENKVYLAVIDCTGHGVPGAFMSMIGHAIFTEILSEKSNPTAADMLEEANAKLVRSLHQDQDANSDGMDACLCVFDFSQENEVIMNYAGAKRSLYYALPSQTQIQTIKATRKSLGGKQRHEKPFENEVLNLPKGTSFYLTTDGFVDQNNPENEKYGTLRLLDTLERINQESMQAQGEILRNELDTFKRQAEQRDDITIIGVRV